MAYVVGYIPAPYSFWDTMIACTLGFLALSDVSVYAAYLCWCRPRFNARKLKEIFRAGFAGTNLPCKFLKCEMVG